MTIALATAPAHAHHAFGTPHYVTDGDHAAPILTLAEMLGPWRLELVHAPGNPDPDQSSELHFRVFNVDAGHELSRPVTVTVWQLHALGPAVTIHGPQAVAAGDDAYESTLTYPEVGNYLVCLAFTDESDISSDLIFPVVVGRPGQPWVSLGGFILGLGVVLLVVRAIKLKQDRRGASSE